MVFTYTVQLATHGLIIHVAITTKDPPPTWQEMYVTHLDTLQTFRYSYVDISMPNQPINVLGMLYNNQ